MSFHNHHRLIHVYQLIKKIIKISIFKNNFKMIILKFPYFNLIKNLIISKIRESLKIKKIRKFAKIIKFELNKYKIIKKIISALK